MTHATPSTAVRLGWAVAGLAALAGLGLAVAAWPLPPWPLAMALTAWFGLLWLRPRVWLVGLPALVVGLDLSPWTGWTMLAEGDLFVLATIAALAWRCPPPLRPRPAATTVVIIVLVALATIVGVWRGLHLPGGDSANPYLRPDNALRLARPVAEALVLLPFLWADRQQAARRLGWGLAVAVAVVAAEAIIERALFPGLLTLSSDYRIAALFGSMRVGGGHIGTFLAMALPAVPMLFLRARPAGRAVLVAIAAAGGYALAVTFARTAYGAAAVGLSLAVLVQGLAFPRATASDAPLAVAGGRSLAVLGLVGLLLAGLGTVASLGFMRERLGMLPADAASREANWAQGWAAHDASLAGWLFGSGLGTYARLPQAGERPTDYALGGDAQARWLTLRPSTPGYIGQKIAPPGAGPLRLVVTWRPETEGARLDVLLCDKHLLYSDACRGSTMQAAVVGAWQQVTASLAADGLGAGPAGLSRPVELSLLAGPPGARLSVRDIALTDPSGRALVANGDFRAGLARWGFTDDRHSAWRMFNLYLMTVFETGLLGLLALAALLGGGAGGAVALVRRGEPMGAALLGGIAAFATGGLFDHVMESPALALIVLLMALTARAGAEV